MAYTDHSLQRDLTLLTEAQRQALEDDAEGRDPPVPAPPLATEAQCLAADDFFRQQEESKEADAERPSLPEKS